MNSMTKMLIHIMIIPLIYTLTYLSSYSNNYFYTWMLMESSYFLYLFMMIMTKNKMKTNFTFFMMNFISSMIMMLCMIISNNGPQNFISNKIINYMFFFMILMKNGMLPFNNWLMYSMNKMTWKEIFLFSTIMKFIPLNLFSQFCSPENYLLLILMLNMILSPIISFNENKIKKILTYSSIFHSSMMMMLSLMNIELFNYYFNMYFMMSMLFFNMLYLSQKTKNNMFYMPKSMKFMLSLFMFIYSNLPPFMTFTIKWLTIELFTSTNINQFMIITMLISSTLMNWNYLSLIKYFHLNKITNKKSKLFMNYSFLIYLMNSMFYLSIISFTLFMIYFYMEI